MKRKRKAPVASCIFLTSMLAVGTSAVGLMILDSENEKNNSQIEEIDEEQTKVFEIGEHLLSVPIDNPTKEIIQYDYHPGYKPVGITVASYGQYGARDGGSCILYTNETEVECRSNKTNGEEYIYDTFGFPMDYEKQESSETLTTKEFDVGEHIISIPIDDPTDARTQFEFHDGYEPVGVASAKYGRYGGSYAGGCILYVNVEPVTCEKTADDNVYLTFGTPTEKELIKVKE